MGLASAWQTRLASCTQAVRTRCSGFCVYSQKAAEQSHAMMADCLSIKEQAVDVAYTLANNVSAKSTIKEFAARLLTSESDLQE